MTADFIPISPDDILAETIRFRAWSNPTTIKLFFSSEGLYPMGSAGLLKYKGRYFVVTNEHVVRSVPRERRRLDIVIPYEDKDQRRFKATIISDRQDRHNDLAAFEIDPNSVRFMNDHFFLDETYMETELNSYIKRSNVVFLHGYPFDSTEIDHSEKHIITTSQCLATTICDFNQYAGILVLHTDDFVISQEGVTRRTPSFSGMSGSFVYGYYIDSIIPYRLIGILSAWRTHDKQLDVFPTSDIITFLENDFF